MTAAVAVDSLSVRVAGGESLLAPLSLSVPDGGTLVIMGETGAGKSLLAQAVMGALPAPLVASGKVFVNKRRVDELARAQREALWGTHLALLPQEPWRALDPLMRAGRQVTESYRLVAGLGRNAALARTCSDFARLGLGDALEKLPGALSGGMAQRVAFAAARAGGAPIMLADEPTKGLDADRRDQVVDLLAEVPRNGGALLAITHDVDVARRLGGEVMVLKDGQLVEQGATQAVLSAPQAEYTRALVDAAPSKWPQAPSKWPQAPSKWPQAPSTWPQAPSTWPQAPSAGPQGMTRPGECLLDASGLALARGGRRLFDGFALRVCRGERVAVTGPSGSGKTSLLDVLAGLLAPDRGTVVRHSGLARTSVQKLYQDPPAAFAPRIALRRSLDDVLKRHGVPRDRLGALLHRLGIAPAMLERRPDAVSGGELQRIALARVLAVSPAVLLADEPTSRLDPITQATTMALLAEVAAEQALAMVLVTHDEAIASRWASRRVAVTANGVRGEAVCEPATSESPAH